METLADKFDHAHTKHAKHTNDLTSHATPIIISYLDC